MRQRYRELVREEVAQTVSSVQEVDEEIRYLIRVVMEVRLLLLRHSAIVEKTPDWRMKY